MSWDDPKTDMAHCSYCSWDLYKANAVDGMHAECAAKLKAKQDEKKEQRKSWLYDLI